MSFECVICFDALGSSETICGSNRCGHVYHGGCIENWITRSQTCPQCRDMCFRTNLIRLFLNPLTTNNYAATALNLEKITEKIIIISTLESKINELCNERKELKNELKRMNGTLLSEKFKFEMDKMTWEMDKKLLQDINSSLKRKLQTELTLKRSAQNNPKVAMPKKKVKTTPLTRLHTVQMTELSENLTEVGAASRIPIPKFRRSHIPKRVPRRNMRERLIVTKDSDGNLLNPQQTSPVAGPSGMQTRGRGISERSPHALDRSPWFKYF